MKVREKEGISEGDVFLCIKDASYSNNDDLIFKVGKIYKSVVAGCICDEGGNSYHGFTRPYWTQYLVKINGCYYDDAIAQKLNLARLLRKYGYVYNFKTKEIINKED